MGNQTDLIAQIKEVESENKSFYEKLYNFSLEWVSKQFKPFTVEDLKRAFYSEGFKAPKNGFVYGRVIKTLSNEKRLLHHGFCYSNAIGSRGRVINIWISREYSLKQKNNATKDETLSLDFDES